MSYTAQTPMLIAQGFAPVTTISGTPAMGVGAWRNPPGWRQRWIWTGDIVEYPPTKGRKRASQQAPRTVLAHSAAHEQQLLSQPGAMLASQMPPEVKDMLLDYHGHDINDTIRMLCADRIAARAAPPAKPKAALKAPVKRARK